MGSRFSYITLIRLAVRYGREERGVNPIGFAFWGMAMASKGKGLTMDGFL